MKTLSLVMSSREDTTPQPALFVGLCGDAPSALPRRISLANASKVAIGRGTETSISRTRDGAEQAITLTLSDGRLSSQHARVTRFGGTWSVEDLGSKNGTYVNGARVERHQLADHDVFVIGHTAIVFRDSGGEAGDHVGLPAAPDPGLMTFSPAAKGRFDVLARAARSPIPIELTGESGTGKELAARAVHTLSGRTGRFVAVNCGAIAPTLLEAELFGHKKGAFTGADTERQGLIRAADGGTLFLDEIAELPAQAQAALLRVLQEREVIPVGGDQPIRVDLRLVTATLKNLDDEVAAGRFREDLRARLLGIAVKLTPLRERREDLGWLISTLLRRVGREDQVTFAADVISRLYSYDWPMNIRELERVLAAASIDGQVQLQSLPTSLRDASEPATTERPLSPADIELRDTLVAAIKQHEGNLSAVARQMGRDPKQVRRWVKRFKLSRDE